MEYEEFQESDIIFSDDYSSSSDQGSTSPRRRTKVLTKRKKGDQRISSSIPVNIPGSGSSSPSSSFRYDDVEFGGDFLDDEDEMVPPHVIVDRRSSGDFNSYEKNVKGKNLIHVRNSILKLTGFLES